MVTITTKSAVEIGGIVHPGGKPFDVEDSVAEALKAGGVKLVVAVAKTSETNATQKEAIGSEGTVTTEEPVVSAKNTSGKKK